MRDSADVRNGWKADISHHGDNVVHTDRLLFLITHPIGMQMAIAASIERPLFQSAAMNRVSSTMSISSASAGSQG
jgi:hypothetical protein